MNETRVYDIYINSNSTTRETIGTSYGIYGIFTDSNTLTSDLVSGNLLTVDCTDDNPRILISPNSSPRIRCQWCGAWGERQSTCSHCGGGTE